MKSNVQFKKIKAGNVAKFIRSKRQRDDIPCSLEGCYLCESPTPILTLNRAILFLDYNIVAEQIDAIENFEIINNCIIPLSEYLLINQKNQLLFKRFNQVLEQRNIYIFPNEFHSEIIVADETTIKRENRQNTLFAKTAEYLFKHFMIVSKDIKFIVLTNTKSKENYLKTELITGIENEEFKENLSIYTMKEFADAEMKESPDLFNYIALFDEKHEKLNVIDQSNDVQMQDGESTHLSEAEMKQSIKQGNFFQGKVMFQPNNLTTANVKVHLFDKDVVVDNPERLNRAYHGDIVCIEILNEKYWITNKKNIEFDTLNDEEALEDENTQALDDSELNEQQKNIKQLIEKSKKLPVGKVRGILRKFRTQLCGTIINKSDLAEKCVNNISQQVYENAVKHNYEIFIPFDPKFPNFYLKLHQPEYYYNKRIVIKYDTWIENQAYPIGHFIKSLGEVNDVKVENEVILLEHAVDVNPFSQKIINSLPNENAQLKVTDEDLRNRKDLRNLNICSIDPPGCKDIDDALHCRLLPNGDYEIGVHIADVTHYVKAGSEVDRIAAKNSNTVYMVHKRTDMLPKVLTENLCSLVGNKERFAFSVTWVFDKDSLEIKDVQYFKSIIKSKAAMTYQQANDRINDQNDQSELTLSIRNLLKISRHLRQKRLEAGALILASTEMKFVVDFETNSINDISMYKGYETNQLVEEYMLLANVYVAQKIYETYPSCAVLRRHPLPKLKELGSLKKLLEENGFKINVDDSKLLGESVDSIKKDNDPFFNKLVRIMLTRTMNQAKYFPSCEFGFEDFFHYGLAMPIYTHFTSPIRRYADVLVHRLLAAALDIDYLPIDMSNKVKSNKQCDQMNRQNRVAFFCSRASNEFSTYLFFKDKVEELEISIFSVDSFGIRGLSQKYGIEAEILFVDNQGNNLIKKIDLEKKQILMNDNSIINIFDRVLVSINAGYVNYRREIKYKFLKKIE